ncbi:hypothetical protein BOVMAS02_06540 [Streptococcus uberis]
MILSSVCISDDASAFSWTTFSVTKIVDWSKTVTSEVLSGIVSKFEVDNLDDMLLFALESTVTF